jgi:hypothetical protein
MFSPPKSYVAILMQLGSYFHKAFSPDLIPNDSPISAIDLAVLICAIQIDMLLLPPQSLQLFFVKSL